MDNNTAIENAVINEIASLIGKGADDAIHMREVAKYTGLNSREVREGIEILRCSGDVICGDTFGYYRPTTIVELRRWVLQEQARLKSIKARMESAEKRLAEWEHNGEEGGGNG